MASIKLTDLQDEGLIGVTNIATSEAGVGPLKKFTFADLKMDLEIGEILTNIPVDQPRDRRDAQALYDIEAIKRSVENIFNTTPGEKLLNPLLGIDLKRFLFEPVNERVGKQIADTIVHGLVKQEPRVAIEKISVRGVRDEASYYITLVLKIPHLKGAEIVTDGKLNSSGFVFTSNNTPWQLTSVEFRDSTWDFDQKG